MPLHRPELSEGQVANATSVRPLASVSPVVDYLPVFRAECLPAVRATVRPLPGMYPLMNDQCRVSGKELITDFTLVFLYALVYFQDVFGEVVLVGKRIVAYLADVSLAGV